MMHRLTHYLALHAQNLLGTLGRMARQPVGSLMTIVVIAIALALPTGLRVLLNNAQILSGSWDGAIDFTVYLKLDVDTARAEELTRDVQAREDVTQTVFISRSEALAEFRAYSGFGEALDVLDENPLPHALIVRPASGDKADVEALAGALALMPETDFVQLDTAWVERLNGILDLARRVVDMATILLSLAVVLVIGNTIRLEINNRREEIQVVKLVGGSDGFIRRPFLYMGFFYGLAGAAMAALTVTLSLSLLASPAHALAQLYGSSFNLAGLTWLQTLLLLGSGALLGWAGAGVAAARHLRAIEPR
ncbi:MAG: permease-like cell division protein FtsX [Gammaproteobacteria bacterium]|nr:permease-like cell division protein FtsX [Gammaproteobacteria bacterium]